MPSETTSSARPDFLFIMADQMAGPALPIKVGALLGTLDALGLADNTVVVFTADHGDMMGKTRCEAIIRS